MARVVIITQYYPPEVTAAAFRLAALRSFLKGFGHDVLVITTYPHKTANSSLVTDEQGILRLHMPREPRGTAARLLHQALFMLRVIAQFPRVWRWRPDYVISSSPPLPVGMAGLVLSKILRLPHVLDLRDVWPGSVVAAGVMSSTAGLYRLATRFERWVYCSSRWIMTVAKPMAEYVSQYVDPDRLQVVYNGISREPPCSPESRSGARNPLRLAFAGNVGLVQGLEVLPEAFSMLPDSVQRRLAVRVIGAGPRLDFLRTEVGRLGLQHAFTFEGPYPVERLHEVICAEVDALFLHLKDDPVLRLTIPSTLFDYLLYGLPIVYGLSGEGAAWLESLPGNVRFQQESPESLKDALLRLVANYPALAQQARANVDFVVRRFTRDACFAPYRQALGTSME